MKKKIVCLFAGLMIATTMSVFMSGCNSSTKFLQQRAFEHEQRREF